jgi:hypothetical protein
MYWGWKVGGLLVVSFMCAAAACCLPDNSYQRFQLTDGTLFNTLRYAYERIHFDSRPIDVAIVGPSRSQLGLSAPIVQRRLASLGWTANVENFSVIADGRNVEWSIVNEIFKVKSPKVIVVAVDETPYHYGHPAFKYIAPADAIIFPPSPLLHNYLYDLLYLPFRQIKLFLAMLAPGLSGLQIEFDPQAFARTPTDFTISHRLPDGRWIEMGREIPRTQLVEEARAIEVTRTQSKVSRFLEAITTSDDQLYIQQIAAAAHAHGARLVFVFMPTFNGASRVADMTFLERYGTVVDNGDLTQQDKLYEGWAHFNHAGAVVVSNRLATAIANLSRR